VLRNTGKLTTATCALWGAGFLFIASAAAQGLPKTVPFNDAEGKAIGTATFSLGGIYIRDLKGEPIATIARDRDGKWTLYDPHGKVLDQLPGK